ncbi:MAG: transglutaminase family protein [Spirochaetaceae bacterium]|nr:transglutaminase family protein [Spirochaetaceae bacterium]
MGARLAAQTVTASYIYAAHYGYSDCVLHNDNHLRISPTADASQEPLDQQLWTRPEGRSVKYRDRFGNRVQRVRIVAPHDRLVVATAGRIRLAVTAPAPDDVGVDEVTDLPDGFDFAFRSPLVDPDGVAEVAREVAGDAVSLLAAVRATVEWVHREIGYRRGATGVTTTAEQVLAAREGVCQDKTHLALGMLRALGIPCRYVSGLLTGQVGETHAWLEVLHPRSGWVAADPTRGVLFPPASDYIKLAVGRDYSDVSPVSGSFLSTGAATECAAISAVRFADTEAVLDDALELLSTAYVVRNGA